MTYSFFLVEGRLGLFYSKTLVLFQNLLTIRRSFRTLIVPHYSFVDLSVVPFFSNVTTTNSIKLEQPFVKPFYIKLEILYKMGN